MVHVHVHVYRSVPDKRPLPGKRPCTEFLGITVAASIQTYGIYIPGKYPYWPKSRVMFKRPWAITRDTTVILWYMCMYMYNTMVHVHVRVAQYGRYNNIVCISIPRVNVKCIWDTHAICVFYYVSCLSCVAVTYLYSLVL